MFVNFNILNQLGSPAINSNTFANRPAAGQTGRLFVSTDTFEIYRDNGTTWDLIGGPGSSTITGTGTATQVAYFTSSQAIGSSADLYWDNTNTRLGIGTSSPGVRLDVHGTGVMMHINSTSGTSNSLMSFQRTGTNVWRIGDNYNSGDNFFELRNSVLSNDALTIQATTNKAAFLAEQTYSTGQAQGALFTYNLTAPAGTTFATPNALSAVNAFLNLSLGGNATLPAGTRQGIEGNSRVSFTGAGTLTMSQGSTLRAYAAITGVHSFAGSAIGTITHLAGIRLCFPDNIGSAINITNNYGLLINDQSAGTGTITYTNRWGIYQEGASDLNYFAANTLIGGTTNNGLKLQVTGQSYFSDNIGLGVIPNAWGTVLKAFDIGTSGSLVSSASGAGGLSVARNAYYNGLVWIYKNTSTAQFYEQDAGQHAWYTAPSGTAGNTISFSQIMTLTAAGNLGIGTNSPASILHVSQDAPSSGSKITITNTSSVIYSSAALELVSHNGTSPSVGTSIFSTNNNFVYGTISSNQTNLYGVRSGGIRIVTGLAPIIFGNGNSDLDFANERMRIVSGGNILIGTTTDAGQKLQVSGVISLSANSSTLTDLNGKNYIRKGDDNSYYAGFIYQGVSASDMYFGRASSSDDLIVSTANNVSPAERVRFKQSGQVRFVPLGADPAGAQSGDVYYNSGTNKLRLYDGSNWVDLN